MSELIMPNTNDLKVAILTFSTYYANKMQSSYEEHPPIEGKNDYERYIESWDKAFKAGAELAKNAVELPF